MQCARRRLSTSSVLPSHLLSTFLTAKAGTGGISSTRQDPVEGGDKRFFNARLPPEIWLRVFEMLVLIPGTLELSNGLAIEAYSEDSNGVILHGLYDESLRLKLNVSLVSWTWRRLILPLLFEYVIIKNARHAEVVASALVHFKKEQGDDEYYGLWIKRVEVIVSDNYWEKKSLDALRLVLRLSPNLAIFSDFFSLGRLPNYSTRKIVKTLRKLCEGGRLRRLESSGACAPYLQRLLRDAPSLEVLIAKRLSLRSGTGTLPKLHTLVSAKAVMPFAHELENLKAPNLQNLILHNSARYSKLGCGHIRISTLYPNLKHLRCDWVDDSPSMSFLVDIHSLTSITIDLGLWQFLDDLDKLRIAHPTLQRINLIRFTTFIQRAKAKRDGGGDSQEHIADFLSSLPKNNPSLRTIGFLRDQSYFDTGGLTKQYVSRGRGPHLAFWESFLVQCKAQGIDVVASVGASDHFCGIWRPFHLGLVPRRVEVTKIEVDLFRLCI